MSTQVMTIPLAKFVAHFRALNPDHPMEARVLSAARAVAGSHINLSPADRSFLYHILTDALAGTIRLEPEASYVRSIA